MSGKFQELLKQHDGSRFQAEVANLVLEHKPDLIIETGVCTGNSTLHILDALEKNGKGKLISIDPNAVLELEHPQWVLLKEKSVTALPKVYAEYGPCDIFLHDSDHNVACQTFEYDYAWKILNKGGYLITDDVWWGQPCHHAWDKFCAEVKIKDGRLGCAGIIRKNAGRTISKKDAVTQAVFSKAKAYAASVAYGDAEQFQDYK